MNQTTQNKSSKIFLLVADVDGTLVTREKILSDRTTDAVRQLSQADIIFTLVRGN